MREIPIAADDDGIRLDRWFRRHLPQVAHGQLQAMLRRRLVRLDGLRAAAATRVQRGQVLRLPGWLPGADAPESREPAVRDSGLAAMVLEEDDGLLVLNKPAGLPVQAAADGRGSVAALLPVGAHPVHRLDRDTSGVLLVAKTAAAAARWAAQFRRREVKKSYLALVIGVPRPHRGTIDLPLSSGGELARAVVDAGGRPARTHYHVLQSWRGDAAWLELEPETGRKHQLRAHLAAIGHPVVGDGKYGGRAAHAIAGEVGGRVHLHARCLVGRGADGRERRFTAPLPPHMAASALRTEFDPASA